MVSAFWYRIIRLALWLIAVIVAIFPALLESLRATALDHTLAREFMFVVIPASALALSTVLDYLCMHYRIINGTSFALSMLAIILNVFAMASGLVGFLVIAKDQLTVSKSELWTFSTLILLALLVSLATEMLVSTGNHRCHHDAKAV